jgi:type VI secretion system protein ImpK
MAQQRPPSTASSAYPTLVTPSPLDDTHPAEVIEGNARISLPKNLNGGVLVAQFHAFYGEVLSIAKRIEQFGALDGEQSGSETWTEASHNDHWAGDLVADPNQAIAPMPEPSSGQADPTLPPALAANLAQSNSPKDSNSDPAASTPQGSAAAQAAAARRRKDRWPVMVDEMVRRLAHLLDLGADQAIRLGGAYGATLYSEAQYAMAALADEVFLHQVHWAGAEAWGDNLLETHLFDSAIAGERLFQNIDAMLADGSPAHTELASVYLMVLTLGFQGRYRGRSKAEIDAYRTRLRVFISHRVAPVQDDEPIFADSYHHTLDEGRETLLPAIARWVWVAIAALILYLLVSEALWIWSTSPVQSLVQGG